MKAKILVLSVVAMFIALSGFISKTSEKSNPPGEPDGFYVRVCLQQVPFTVQSVLIKVYFAGQLWDQTSVNPASECNQYSKWHADFSGTIHVTVTYYYSGCWYTATQSQSGDFDRLHWPNTFTFSSYTVGNCD